MTRQEQELFGLSDSIDEHCSTLGVKNGKIAAALIVCLARLVVQRTITREEIKGQTIAMAVDCAIGVENCQGLLKSAVLHLWQQHHQQGARQ